MTRFEREMQAALRAHERTLALAAVILCEEHGIRHRPGEHELCPKCQEMNQGPQMARMAQKGGEEGMTRVYFKAGARIGLSESEARSETDLEYLTLRVARDGFVEVQEAEEIGETGRVDKVGPKEAMVRIKINLDRKCRRCGKAGALENWLCLECMSKAILAGEF